MPACHEPGVVHRPTRWHGTAAGEITVPGLHEKVREAAAQKRVPALSPLRKDLRSILRSKNSTIVAMCSPAGSVDPDVLVAKDAMRKQVMKKTLQVSTILNCVFMNPSECGAPCHTVRTINFWRCCPCTLGQNCVQMLSSVADRLDDLRDVLEDISSMCFVLRRILLLSLPPSAGKKCATLSPAARCCPSCFVWRSASLS